MAGTFWSIQYFGQDFWPENYYGQGEEAPEGSIYAGIHASGAVSGSLVAIGHADADLTASGVLAGEISSEAAGSISAALSVSATLTATISYTGSAVVEEPAHAFGGGGRGISPDKWKFLTPKQKKPKKTPRVVAELSARITTSSDLTGSLSAVAWAESSLNAGSFLSGDIGKRHKYIEDNSFWLMAA